MREVEEYHGYSFGNTVINLRRSIGSAKTVLGLDNKVKNNNATNNNDKDELDLGNMEVIEIDESDEDNKDQQQSKTTTIRQQQRNNLPFFDYMPDEVIFNIFYCLPEKDMGKFGSTCKRMYECLEIDDIWEKKAKEWIYLRVSRPGEGIDRLKYYTEKYNENVQKEEVQRKQRILLEKRSEMVKKVQVIFPFVNSVFFNYITYEIPIWIMIIIWTILMALREDEYILWSYHLVFLPIYLDYFYVFLSCLISFTIVQVAHNTSVSLNYRQNLLSFITEETRAMGFLIVAPPYLMSLSFFILYDLSKESDGTMSGSYSFIPFGVVGILSLIVCCVFSCSFGEILILNSGLFVFCYFGWLFAFLAVKNDDYVFFNWMVCLVPFWILVCIVGVLYCMFMCFVFLTSMGYSEKRLFGLVSAFFLPSFVAFVTWLILLSCNLDAQDRDLPLIPWIVVDMPIIIMEVVFLCGFTFFFWINQ